MDADLAQLDRLAAQLRAFDRVGFAIAEDAMPAVLAAAKATAAAATDPNGQAWAPTKDGRAALPKAAGAITATVSGTTKAVITLILPFPYRFHQGSKNKSAKKGLPRRVVLPNEDTGLPDSIRDAIKASAVKIVKRTLGGGA